MVVLGGLFKVNADIQIPDIETELKHIWRINREKNLTKACLFNLIIFSPDKRRTDYLKLVVRNIIEKFPCRIIFINLDTDDQANFLHVSASTITSDVDENIIACDQINVEVSKNLLERIPYLIISYLVSDLPLYLLWGQNPVEENVVLPHLIKYATRLIFDSQCLESLSSFSEGIFDKLNKFKIEIMDMNWAFLSVWRNIFVQVFDTPEKIHQLNDSKTITITFNSFKSEILEHAEIRPLYLQAWLAAQLKWKFDRINKDHQKTIITYKNSHPITVILTPQKHIGGLSPGSIITIEIVSYKDESCYISRQQNISQVLVNFSTQEKCELPNILPLRDIHRGFAFLKEIIYHKLSGQYHNMLKVISQTCKKNI